CTCRRSLSRGGECARDAGHAQPNTAAGGSTHLRRGGARRRHAVLPRSPAYGHRGAEWRIGRTAATGLHATRGGGGGERGRLGGTSAGARGQGRSRRGVDGDPTAHRAVA